MSCACLAPAKRVWCGLRARLGRRPSCRRAGGLGRLRMEVRACEYNDIHVMWDMLSGTGVGDGHGRRRPTAAGNNDNGGEIRLGRVGTKLAAWSRLASYCCAM